MASASSVLNPSPLLRIPKTSPRSPISHFSPISCGPRDNRGPLLRGRTLSTEAILAIQALKRSAGDGPRVERVVATALARLVKADLLAALAELRRQGHWRLALKVFGAARREPWYKTDVTLYADMVSTLARCGAAGEIDPLVSELMAESGKGGNVPWDDIRGIARLVKALIAAGKGKAVREVYGEMKKGGCEADEFLFRVMIRGLRRLGESEAADEVEKDFEEWYNGGVIPEPLPV